MVAVTADAKGQQGGTDAVEESSRHLRAQPDEGHAKKCGGQGILFERRVVRILPGQNVLSGAHGPSEIGGSLVEMQHQEIAECRTRHANHRGDADSQSQRKFARISCNMEPVLLPSRACSENPDSGCCWRCCPAPACGSTYSRCWCPTRRRTPRPTDVRAAICLT